jgi:hypothetical protein
MHETGIPEHKDSDPLNTRVGISVVVFATFLGICHVKDDNILQKMHLRLNDRNDNWAWFQARKIRADIYQAAADQLSVPYPSETSEIKQIREAKAAAYRADAAEQRTKSESQKKKAEAFDLEYAELNSKDDQFDLSEATLSVALAMMGMTALTKKRFLFIIAWLVGGFGLFMGIAGFCGLNTGFVVIRWLVNVLS